MNQHTKSKPSWVNKYTVQFPDGHTEEVSNLAEFCREHNLRPSAMYETAKGIRNHHRGYSAYLVEKVGGRPSTIPPAKMTRTVIEELGLDPCTVLWVKKLERMLLDLSSSSVDIKANAMKFFESSELDDVVNCLPDFDGVPELNDVDYWWMQAKAIYNESKNQNIK